MNLVAASVRVPATSANLGPGFDAFGLAVSLYDYVEARPSDERGFRVAVEGEGAHEVPVDGTHLVASALRAGLDELDVRVNGMDLLCRNTIPHGRGLGSSAAAIIAGLSLARAITGATWDDEALLRCASRLEGHPDNVAACLLGGFTIAWTDADGVHAVRSPVHQDIQAVAFVPANPVSTKMARGLLPAEVPHADAAVNAGRTALLVHALEHRPDLLVAATADSLHQAYRRSAYPSSYAAVTRLRDAGFAATVSGAGPTVLVLGMDLPLPALGQIVGADFETIPVTVDLEGAVATQLG